MNEDVFPMKMVIFQRHVRFQGCNQEFVLFINHGWMEWNGGVVFHCSNMCFLLCGVISK